MRQKSSQNTVIITIIVILLSSPESWAQHLNYATVLAGTFQNIDDCTVSNDVVRAARKFVRRK